MHTAEEAVPRVRGRETDGGFTLIELIVVMMILGVLAAIAIPAYNGQVRAAHKASAQAWVTNATKAVYIYDLTYGVWPASLAAADAPPAPSDINTQYYPGANQFCLSAYWNQAPWVNGFGPLNDTYKTVYIPDWGRISMLPVSPESFCVNNGG